jgi:hypothetical protein
MFCFRRHIPLFSISLAFVILETTPAHAQFYGSPIPSYGWYHPTMTYRFSTRGFAPIPRQYFGGLRPVMPVRPLTPVNGFNPLMFNPLNPNYSPALANSAIYYGLNRIYASTGYSTAFSAPGYSSLSPAQPGVAGSYGGYMSGSALARDFGRAQSEAGRDYGIRNSIADQAAYERREAAKAQERPGARALVATNGAEIASGAALNRILAAAIALDRGEKLNSVFLPPNLLAEIRFAGGDPAEALNLIRAAGHLPFPKAFEAGPMAELKPRIEKDVAAVAAPLLAGKPRDPAAVAALEGTVQKARAAMKPAEKDLDFEGATALRRFVNQLDSTVAALKKADAAALFVPRWATEGTSVAELIRHMAKFKLQFAPAPKGAEESYAALHRGLADYLIALLDRSAPAKKS